LKVEFSFGWLILNVDVGLLLHFASNIYLGVYWLGVGQILETVSITGKKTTQNTYEKQATSDKKTYLPRRHGKTTEYSIAEPEQRGCWIMICFISFYSYDEISS
jgi:hypothetical protein